MSLLKEIWQVATGEVTEDQPLSLTQVIGDRIRAEIAINRAAETMNAKTSFEAIAIIIPIVIACISRPSYFGTIFGTSGPNIHQRYLQKQGVPELADSQSLAATLFSSVDVEYVFTLKDDPNSLIGKSVNFLGQIIDTSELKLPENVDRLTFLRTHQLSEGVNLIQMFKDPLLYTNETSNFESILISNIINTYMAALLATGQTYPIENIKYLRLVDNVPFDDEKRKVLLTGDLYTLKTTNVLPKSWENIWKDHDKEGFAPYEPLSTVALTLFQEKGIIEE